MFNFTIALEDRKKAHALLALICETIPNYGEEILEEATFSFEDEFSNFDRSRAWGYSINASMR